MGGWTLVGDLVRLIDETDTVRIGPDQGTTPLPKLEVVGNSRITLQDKGGNVFDVKAYGAKGDGATDDRGAIQAAINAMPANGGMLYLPPGNYFVSKDPSNAWSLSIVDKAVLIRGAGPDATIITLTNATAHGIRTNFTLADATDRELYMEIRDLKIVSSGTPTAGAAIFQECTNPIPANLKWQNTFLVRNCWFLNVWDGIRLTNAGSAIIQGCQILNPLHAAIVLESTFNELNHGDVGVPLICDNFIWDRIPPAGNHPAGQEIHGILATTGVSGMRVHHNSFLNFDRPIYIDLTDVGGKTIIHIDHNSIDGGSKDAKISVRNGGILRTLDISSNDITVAFATGVGVLVDVNGSASTQGLFNGVIAGNTFNNLYTPTQDSRKGIVLTPSSQAVAQRILIGDNIFTGLLTGIEIGTGCDHVYIGSNAFENVGTPLSVALPTATRTLGAFFPDRLGVGKLNDLATRKELYVYSNAPIGPRLYLEGVAGTSSPGIDFAFDNTNVRRVGIVGAVSGTSGAQLEFYTKPNDANPLKRRVIIDPNGRMQLLGTTAPLPGAIDFLFDSETTPRASITATPVTAGAQLEFWTGGSLGGFAQRAQMTPAGHFIPAADNSYNLGQASGPAQRWKDLLAVTKTSVLNTGFGSGLTLVPVLEGPEYLLYDSGSVTLGDSGEAFVDLDPRFVEIANTGMPYRVLTSGSKVSDRESQRFRVKGDPGDVVDWMVVAVRAGFENVRFRDADDVEPVGLQDPEHAVARKSQDNNKA